jgi:hypothetical protein
VFDIAMGVRRGDSTFRKQLDDIIVRRGSTIDSILVSYGVPLVDVHQAIDTAAERPSPSSLAGGTAP